MIFKIKNNKKGIKVYWINKIKWSEKLIKFKKIINQNKNHLENIQLSQNQFLTIRYFKIIPLISNKITAIANTNNKNYINTVKAIMTFL